MTHGQGHKANDVFAPKGAWQSGVSADFFALDYDPFGSLLPGRNYSATTSDYRFGFNGMPSDEEVAGERNSYDFGARLYDPRVGRWLSTDPKLKAGESPYAAFSNSPLFFVDPDGKDTLVVHRSRDYELYGRAKIYRITFSVIRNGVQTAMATPGMWMMANAEAEKRGDNSLSAQDYYKLSQDMMASYRTMAAERGVDPEEEFGRQIRVTKFGVFIHAGNTPSSFFGCLGVTCAPPTTHKNNPNFAEDEALISASGDSPLLRSAQGKVEGGLHAMFRIRDEANAAGTLTGDKWLLQPNSDAPIERMEPRPVTIESAPLERTPVSR